MAEDLERWAATSIARGSKSFALASRLFDVQTKRRVRLLYAWCRHCDDVVDGQEGGRGVIEPDGKALERLAILNRRTAAGLADPASESGAYAAIGLVAAETGMPHDLPMRHLGGFAMDAHERRYRSLTDLLDYCEHVAGVVGRMMAVVMGIPANNEAVLTRAADLGLAFQLTNISRDVLEDAANGRCYLPEEMLTRRGITPGDHARPEHRGALTDVIAELLDLAEVYYESAKMGATHLPPKAAWAVLTAEKVYRAIGHKVRAAGPAAWDERQHTSIRQKMGMLLGARAEAKTSPMPLDRRDDLWTYGDTPLWQSPRTAL
ncbi:MAG: phytoene/squalene synthase family protein [Pacificimonas sp.]